MSDAVQTESVVAEPVADDEEPTTTEYVEFLGTDPVHGTEFYGQGGTHVVSNAHLKKYHDVELGAEEAVWKRGLNGRFLVKAGDLNSEAVEVLIADPMFRLVSL